VEGRVNSSLASGSFVFARPVEDEPDTYLLRGLPDHEVVIRATVNEAVYERAHDPLAPTLTFTVPRYDEVTATIAASGDVELDENCYFRLLPIDDESLFARREQLPHGGSGSLVIPSVIPGRYEAVVQRYFDEEDGEYGWEDVSARFPFVVAPEGPTRVTVEL
jgi:hypothetical protein